MLGDRQEAAATELAQWWEAVRLGGVGSHAVLLAAPDGWGRSTVLGRLPEVISGPDGLAGLVVRVSGRSLAGQPGGAGEQAAALRDCLLGDEVRRQAAELLCRNRVSGLMRSRSVMRPGGPSLVPSGLAGTVSLLLAGLAAATGGGAADGSPDSQDGAAARAARIVAAVSPAAPVLVLMDDADALETGLAVTMIENLIEHHDSRVLVVAAVDVGSDLATALAARARCGTTTGRIHRAGTDPRMGLRSRAELASELCPHLTAADAHQLAEQTSTFAEVFAAARAAPPPAAR
jgi:hypothetical protein